MPHSKFLSFLLLFLGLSFLAAAQNLTVTGNVRNSTGQGIEGITVLVKGTTEGTATKTDGSFLIHAPSNATLTLSGVGYVTQEIPLDGKTHINVSLVENQNELNAVVVTALGVQRSAKSLVYANQVVKGSELTDVKSDNLMNSLNGKVAGVTISPSSAGVGGSVKVILRGNKNAFGTNQPLYVIDGMPITNSPNANGQPNGTYGGGPDGGDGISNLNPDDIESISVLEGAAASALYGSQAANGVILITTKKGKAGTSVINFSSSYTNDVISYKPEFQNKYGVTPGGNQSWGPALSTPAPKDNLDEFYQNGQNFTNSINFSSGSSLAQTYFSYANTTASGVQPTNKLDRNNFTFREIGHFLNNKLTVDVSTNYIQQRIDNTPAQGLYFNPITGLYLFPVGTDIRPYKDSFGIPQPTRNGLLTQKWVANEDVQQNPWWILYKNPNYSTRNRLLINASVKYDFADWLNVQVRGNIDRVADVWERDLYAGTNPVLVQGTTGAFNRSEQTFTQKYGDAIANFKIPFKSNSFKIVGLLGASITDGNTIGTSYGQGLGLSIPNVFISQNVVTSTTSNVSTLPANHNEIQSLFGSLNFSYHDWAYLDVTGRNDWSSNLAFTSNESYFYPSVGLSIILSEVLGLPKFISFAKLRGSYAEVATSVPQYITNPINYLAGGGGVTFNEVEPNPELKPTNTKSKEAGIDLRFLDNRLSLSFTWYKSNTYNQFIQYTPAASTGYTVGYLNAGNIQNNGIELLLSYDLVKNNNFNWNTALNYSSNKNLIVELNPAAPDAPILLTGYQPNAYGSALQKGGSWGDIVGVKFSRSKGGQIELNSSGQPINNNTFVKVGNPNPKWQMGWNNSFNYKRFNLSFLVDGKFGGQVLSMTQMMIDSYGTSKASGDARDAGGVKVNAVDPSGNPVTTIDALKWYSTIGGRSGIAEAYMYSATVVRLRQLSLGYNFPIQKHFIKSLRLSVIGSNLLYFYKPAPYDPEITMSTGNGMSGVDVFNQPTTRNIGAQLNISF
jgi:TonB-linked SusC/RagA family outer membrane protein